MSDNRDSRRPYRTLGWHLRFAREQLKKSMLEVSGAVEIDVEVLEGIEYGEQRPNEDILLLLITHLGFEDAEATSLWELAGYSDAFMANQDDTIQQPLAIVMPMDIRIIYTDMTHVVTNDSGVVMNFMQSGGPGNQSMAVARVGMSKEQAHNVLAALQQSLDKIERPAKPKYLPARSSKRQSKKPDS